MSSQKKIPPKVLCTQNLSAYDYHTLENNIIVKGREKDFAEITMDEMKWDLLSS